MFELLAISFLKVKVTLSNNNSRRNGKWFPGMVDTDYVVIKCDGKTMPFFAPSSALGEPSLSNGISKSTTGNGRGIKTSIFQIVNTIQLTRNFVSDSECVKEML